MARNVVAAYLFRKRAKERIRLAERLYWQIQHAANYYGYLTMGRPFHELEPKERMLWYRVASWVQRRERAAVRKIGKAEGRI